MSSSSPLLSLENASFSYGSRPVLQGVTAQIKKGELVAVLGPNGAGKSTLIKLLTGVLSPSNGAVQLSGQALISIPRREVARRVAVVPQDSPVAFSFTALEIVLMGRFPHQGGMAFAQESDLAFAYAALEEVDAKELASRPVSALSGGERQRVLLARALAQDAEVLLLDEPTAHLDVGHQAQALRAIEARLSRCAVVAVLHDLNIAALYATRILLLGEGRLIADGTPQEIFEAERLARCFGHPVEIVTHPCYPVPAVLPRKA